MRSQVKRILLISIVLLAVGALIFGLGFYFLYLQGVKASQKKLSDVQEVLRDLEKKEKELDGLQKSLTEAQIKAHQAKSRVPSLSDREFDNFVRHLYAVAKQTLVEPQPPKAIPTSQARRTGETPIPQGIVPATYDLTLTGDFRRLWDFLSVLEKSARFVEFENFSFTPFKSSDAKATTREETKLTVRITAYATEGLREGPAAAATEEAAAKPKGPAEPAGGATTRPPE